MGHTSGFQGLANTCSSSSSLEGRTVAAWIGFALWERHARAVSLFACQSTEVDRAIRFQANTSCVCACVSVECGEETPLHSQASSTVALSESGDLPCLACLSVCLDQEILRLGYLGAHLQVENAVVVLESALVR